MVHVVTELRAPAEPYRGSVGRETDIESGAVAPEIPDGVPAASFELGRQSFVEFLRILTRLAVKRKISGVIPVLRKSAYTQKKGGDGSDYMSIHKP